MKRNLVLVSAFLVLFMSSCLVSKKVEYVKDMKPDELYKIVPPQPLRVQVGDRLRIVVSAKNPELAIPFNQLAGGYQVSDKGGIEKADGMTVTDGYLVNDQGKIDFPVLGSLSVEELTFDGVKDLIKGQLEAKKLITDPVVKVELINLKITMMGEMGVSVLNVPDSRITLLEAITRAGGLSNNATPDKVAVIREENGNRRIYYNNIESTELFNSPTFYLQQNDIVYAIPKTAKVSAQEDRTWRYWGLFTGLIGVAVGLVAILRN